MPETYQKHQRYILRRFPPFLDDTMIEHNEKLRLLFIVLWSMLIAVPTILAAYTCNYFVKEPLFYFSVLMVLFVLARALHRYCVRWPEGHANRWSYWAEVRTRNACILSTKLFSLMNEHGDQIELATAPYKLKILGYYHRKIDHFLGHFPRGTTDVDINRHYNIRTGITALLFFAAFVVSTVLLAHTEGDDYSQVLILYVLSVASVCVLFYLGKVHCIELPQVILLRHRPEFASDVLFSELHDEKIPFAQPVSDYYTAR
ncbi:hypothetical protein H310_13200 [Aphanomyces invadans]|uniref:Uncharacterized protein n=1 Tax=Aphanomyces invadans TaxID=157072 RepID=A0A024TGQ9_9STRA|nr:hypothetical protein H310_13200 [Aphanomyces invadans]ETV92517.1 hypothetical protein H310_13200 [Aphanomyces invadans]|eukprot:XP_008878824.1 hypothetical protein H310_13200 [Aphanomyces invadans]